MVGSKESIILLAGQDWDGNSVACLSILLSKILTQLYFEWQAGRAYNLPCRQVKKNKNKNQEIYY